MKPTFRNFLITSLSFLILPVLNAQDITGDWYGRIEDPDSARVILHIRMDRKELKATFDSPETNRFNMPVAEITLENDTLILHTLYGNYIGRVNKDYSIIDGILINEDGSTSGLDFGRKKLLWTFKVDTSSLTVLPAKTKSVKAGNPRKIPYTGTRVIKAGNPRVIEIDTSSLIVITPGKDNVLNPIIIEFPDPVTETEFPYQTSTIEYASVITRAIQPEPIPANPMRRRDAANLNIQYLDVDKTLSFRRIWSILEDSKGNIWFSSRYVGICKYDGKSLTHYTENEGLPELSVNTCLIEDRSGNIWIGTANGVCKYDGQSFIHYSGTAISHTTSGLETENGDLWFGTSNGVIVKKGNIWMQYTEDQGLTDNYVNSITEDKDGNLWFGTDGGVCKFNGKSFTHYTEKEGLISNFILCGLRDRYGNLWFGTDRGVSQYDGKSFRQYTTAQGISGNYVLSIAEDRHGNLWFGTADNGVNLYDGNTMPAGQASFTHFTQKEGLTINTIQSIIEDKSNNLWLGTLHGGIMKLQRSSFSYINQFEDICKGPLVSSITEDRQSNIWFGINAQGLIKYDGESFMELTENEGLDDRFIRYFIYGDRDGNIWFNNNLGLHKYDGNFFTQHYDIEVSDTSSNFLICMHKDTVGNIWLGTWGEGLKKMDGESFTSFPQIATPEYITSVLRDSRGDVWYGTATHGVFKYDGEYITKYSIYEGLSDDYVLSLYEDEASNLWIGTEKGGINKYDGQSFTHFTEKEGLCDNMVRSIIGDKRGNTWVGTNDGLSLLSPQSDGNYSITSFGAEDGLKNIIFNLYSVCLDSRNRLWWGTGNSVTMLDLNTFEINQNPPIIQMSNIYVNEEHLDFGAFLSINLNEPGIYDTITRLNMRGLKFSGVAPFYNYPLDLELPHNLNHLTFHFVATEWSAPHDIQYQYILEGMDEEWSRLSKQSTADYRNIPPGDYTFKVKAISKAGTWSETFEYPFTVHPPWYRSNLAYGSYGVLLVLVVLGLVRWRTWSLEKDKRILEGQVKERTREIEQQKEEILSTNEELRSTNEELQSTLDNLKHTQSQLIQSEKLASLGGLVAGVAHEINTPVGIGVTAVSSLMEDTQRMADLYRKEQISRKDFKEFLQTTNNSARLIQKNLERTAQLVQSFKQVSTDQATEEQREFAFKAYLEDVIRSLYPKFKNRNIEIRIDCDEKLKIDSFPGIFAQVFTNLVLNSINHGFKDDREGVIDIIVNKENSNLNIEFKDNGIGIPEEILPKIFDPFFTTDQLKGTGLGLNIVYNLVTQKLGGTVVCESGEAKGVVFIIELPIG